MNEKMIQEIKEYVYNKHIENIKFIQEQYNQHCSFVRFNEDMYCEIKRYELELKQLEE